MPRSARSSSTSRRLRLNTWYSQTACADDLGGKAMAVAWVGWRLHAASLAGLQAALPDPVTVTMPNEGRPDRSG